MLISELADWDKTLKSTNIEAVRYESPSREIWVKFQTGPTVYAYPAAPEVFDHFTTAEKPSEFFRDHIRFLNFRKLGWDDELSAGGETLEDILREIVETVVIHGAAGGAEAVIDLIRPMVLRAQTVTGRRIAA